MKTVATVLFLLLVLPSVLKAADILETFADYSYMLRRAFHQDTANRDFLDDTTANQFVRFAVVTLMPVLRADKAVFTDSLIYAKSAYLLDSTLLGITAVYWFSVDSVKVLDRVPMSLWKLHYQKLLKDADKALHRRPYFYDYTDDTLFIYPTPVINGDDIRIVGWRKIPSLAAVDSLVNIPQKFRAPIFHYAAWLVARARQHPLLGEYKAAYVESMRFVLQANYFGEVASEPAP